MTTTLKLSTPTQLVEAIPHLLGFHPADSLVLVFLRGGRLLVTARLDLTGNADGVRDVISRIEQHGADAVLTVAYSDNPAVAADALTAADAQTGDRIRVIDLIAVTGQRWTSQFTGEAGPVDRFGTVAAQAAYAGLAAAPSLADVLRCIQLDPTHADAVADRIDASRRQVSQWGQDQRRDRLAALLDAAPQRTLTDAETADVIALLSDPPTRDVALGRLTRPDARAQFTAWATIARHTPNPDAAHVLGCAGLAAWLAGEGAAANGCLERAARADITSPTLQLLATLDGGAYPPEIWDTLHAGITA